MSEELRPGEVEASDNTDEWPEPSEDWPSDEGEEVAEEVAETKPSGSLTLFSDIQAPLEMLGAAGVTFTPLGCRFNKGIKEVNAAKIGTVLIRIDQVVGIGMNFGLGDWYTWVQKAFPRKASQIIDGLPAYKYETLKNYGYVAAQIPLELRTQALTWTDYRELAPCSQDVIVGVLTKFRDEEIDYQGVKAVIAEEHKKRIEAERKKRDKTKKAEEKASGKAVAATETSDSAEEGSGDASGETTVETVPQIGIVINVSTAKLISQAEKIVRKAVGSKSKLMDAEVIDFVLQNYLDWVASSDAKVAEAA